MIRRATVEGPLDQALELLRAHRLPYRWSEGNLHVWEAVCPACRQPEWALHIHEPRRGGPITLNCFYGCSEAEIVVALEADPEAIRVGDALRLAEDACDLAARAIRQLAAERCGGRAVTRTAA